MLETKHVKLKTRIHKNVANYATHPINKNTCNPITLVQYNVREEASYRNAKDILKA